MIDLTQIPDEDLKNEYMRRLNARRARAGGRPPVVRPCEFCKKPFSASDMRKHLTDCSKRRRALERKTR